MSFLGDGLSGVTRSSSLSSSATTLASTSGFWVIMYLYQDSKTSDVFVISQMVCSDVIARQIQVLCITENRMLLQDL